MSTWLSIFLFFLGHSLQATEIHCVSHQDTYFNNINDIQEVFIKEEQKLIQHYNCKMQNSNFCSNSRTCDIISDSKIKAMVKQLERGTTSVPGHSTKIIRAKHSKGKTKYSVVLIHGLYLSPKSTQEFAELYSQLGFNVINVRLPGHFEIPRKKLNSVRWKSWDNKVKQALKLAQNLGEKVIISGHSSGALLAQKASLDYAHGLEGAIPISGFIGYTPTLQIKKKLISGLKTANSWLGTAAGGKGIALKLINEYFSSSSDPIYASLNPSLEINKLSEYITNQYSKNSSDTDDGNFYDEFSHGIEKKSMTTAEIISDIYKPLNKIPVMIMDTASDKIINTSYNQKVMQFLKKNSNKDIVYLVEKNSCLEHNTYLKKLLQKPNDFAISDFNKCSESILNTKIELLNFIKRNFKNRCEIL